MNKYINKDVGKNVIYSYKRASNILDKENKEIIGKPDAVLFRKDEEKNLFEKINEIRKAFTVRDDDKNYENLLIKLSDIKPNPKNDEIYDPSDLTELKASIQTNGQLEPIVISKKKMIVARSSLSNYIQNNYYAMSIIIKRKSL